MPAEQAPITKVAVRTRVEAGVPTDSTVVNSAAAAAGEKTAKNPVFLPQTDPKLLPLAFVGDEPNASFNWLPRRSYVVGIAEVDPVAESVAANSHGARRSLVSPEVEIGEEKPPHTLTDFITRAQELIQSRRHFQGQTFSRENAVEHILETPHLPTDYRSQDEQTDTPDPWNSIEWQRRRASTPWFLDTGELLERFRTAAESGETVMSAVAMDALTARTESSDPVTMISKEYAAIKAIILEEWELTNRKNIEEVRAEALKRELALQEEIDRREMQEILDEVAPLLGYGSPHLVAARGSIYVVGPYGAENPGSRIPSALFGKGEIEMVNASPTTEATSDRVVT